MNCRQARIDLALCVGEDLPEPARRESLRRHVAQCPGCRAHYKRLRSALRVLESADDQRTYDVSGSLWPQVSNRIRRLDEGPVHPTSRFNGWLPFVAVTAACALLVVVMDTTPTKPAASVARDIFGIPSLIDRSSEPKHSQAFLPVGAGDRWSPESYEINPYHNERAALEHSPTPSRSTQND